MEIQLMLIHHGSVTANPEGNEDDEGDGLRKWSSVVEGKKNPSGDWYHLQKELLARKHSSFSRVNGKVMENPINSPSNRFSFLRRRKPPIVEQSLILEDQPTVVLSDKIMFPEKMICKEDDFEYDMNQEIETEIERRAHLPPGGENIWQ